MEEKITGVSNDQQSQNLKFCKFCGEKIHMDAVICTKCGRQVEELKSTLQPNMVINNHNLSKNTNANVNANANINSGMVRPKNKTIAILLCLFLGFFGAHKFYEGKVGMGVLYFFTLGLFFIGVVIDLIALLGKPSRYYV